MSSYSIYLLKFPNGKVYVGQTKKTIEQRFASHKWDRTNSKNEIHRPIIHAMKKYKNLVVCEKLEENLNLDEANFLEKYYIKYFNSTNIKNGYNSCLGGNAGSIMTSEGKKRWKESMTKYYSDPDYNKKITKKLIERKFTDPDYYLNQRKYIKDYFNNVENRIKHSKTKGGKPFKCVETGEVFYSLVIAAEKLKCFPQNIRKVLLKKRKTTNKLSFVYIKE